MRTNHTKWLAVLLISATAAGSLVMAQSVTVSVSANAKVALKPGTADPVPKPCRKAVDLVICLDTSGSMSALIDSARARLWDIVNELATLDPTPELRVGLLTYGSPNRSTAAQGWVLRHTDLTNDLDTVYARMMEMTTNGGDEFVGWVLNDAVQTMNWSTDPSALKMIFVAGNESAEQGADRFNFRSVSADARGKGVTINAIYAGGEAQGVSEHWDQVALHGGGRFAAIDMQAATQQTCTPHDKVLIELNAELNATYVPYGKSGREGKANQASQDVNAGRLGGQSAASRVQAKATPLYNNARWDLIDAQAEADFDVSELEKEELPVAMRTMTTTEQRKFLAELSSRRGGIKKKIQEVSRKREIHLRRAKKARGKGQAGLDDAMKIAIRRQAEEKGFSVRPNP